MGSFRRCTWGQALQDAPDMEAQAEVFKVPVAPKSKTSCWILNGRFSIKIFQDLFGVVKQFQVFIAIFRIDVARQRDHPRYPA